MLKMLKISIKIFKAEAVLCISTVMAVLTMFFVPPSKEYISYIDFRVLSLLFCLMTVVAGFNKTGVFVVLSDKLLHKTNNTRSLCFVLIMLCFFTSMWITNDVALITFVPFAIMLLSMAGQSRYLIFVIVMQTIAANLGSMLTPVGNPQNLYLYSYYKIPIGDFFMITLPVTLISFVILCAVVLMVKKEQLAVTIQGNEERISFSEDIKPEDNLSSAKELHTAEINNVQSKLTAIYGLLFIVCLLCVLRLLDYRLTLAVVLSTVMIFDRKIIRKVDYTLLLTFVCFFIFVGNIGNITVIKDFLGGLLKGRELIISLLVSQGISNVPAAVLLSAFTDNSRALILGTDIGGLGTLVASLASLISYKLYCRADEAKPLRYLGIFTLYNAAFLIMLIIFETIAL